jgi:hypothetical protein
LGHATIDFFAFYPDDGDAACPLIVERDLDRWNNAPFLRMRARTGTASFPCLFSSEGAVA